MTNITTLEAEGLQGICDSDFHDGADRVDNPVWTWSANPWSGTQGARLFSGVMSSLVKKGLAKSEGHGKDDCCRITQDGWDALQATKKGKEA
jgi:hypothetical protein